MATTETMSITTMGPTQIEEEGAQTSRTTVDEVEVAVFGAVAGAVVGAGNKNQVRITNK